MVPKAAGVEEAIKTLVVNSDAFNNRGYIPPIYTCDKKNINPPLTIQNIPHETKSMVILVEDPDGDSWVHWMVWNIPPISKINEDSVPGEEGLNDFNRKGYGGPCPPSGTHHYYFKVYALNDMLHLKSNCTKEELEKAMHSHIIGYGELIGIYKRAL
jgi:Raf kinase inhibitor-like YbhB/YbcL family protein